MSKFQNGNDAHFSLKQEGNKSIRFWFAGEDMEPASGIEPPTYGLRINWGGVAEVLDRTGNPLALPV